MAGKKKFYTVRRGKQTGVFLKWDGPGGAKEQVSGFQGAEYRGFETRLEAEYYLQTGRLLPASEAGAAENEEGGDAGYSLDLATGKVVIFTDGASSGNPGPGGYGVVLLYGKERRELSAGFRCTTNNRMELTACIAALQTLKRKSSVVIYSDSRYVVSAVQQGWARRWQANDWHRAPAASGQVFKAENVDLWQVMLELLAQHEVEFRWVKGHASSRENERCDRLAVAAAKKPNLPADPGFPVTACR